MKLNKKLAAGMIPALLVAQCSGGSTPPPDDGSPTFGGNSVGVSPTPQWATSWLAGNPGGGFGAIDLWCVQAPGSNVGIWDEGDPYFVAQGEGRTAKNTCDDPRFPYIYHDRSLGINKYTWG